MEGGLTWNCDEEEWEYCQRDCLHTIFLLTGREGGGGWIDTKFWFGGDTAKEAVYKCTSTC